MFLDLPSIGIFVFCIILMTIFYFHSKRQLRFFDESFMCDLKDSDQPGSREKYKQHVGVLGSTIEKTRDKIASFILIWQLTLLASIILLSIVLYYGYLSKIQILERIDNHEIRIQKLED